VKLLIVKLSAFGDIIHALPALQDLSARPEVDEIHWLVDTRYDFVTKVFPPQVKVHSVALRGNAPLASAWRAVRTLRAERFDAVLDLQGLLKSAILARLAGSPTYGIDAAHLREPASRLFITPVSFHAEERHVVQQYRRVAAAPFADSSKALAYSAPEVAADAPVRQAQMPRWLVVQDPFVWLHLGGGWATKQLPQETWRQLADALVAQGITPLLGWGNIGEKQVAAAIKAAVPAAVLPDRRLEMAELCGALSRAAVVVGADTGVIHLAAALGTPTVSFWGASASWRSAPLGDLHRYVESNPHCGPCFKRTCDAFICMNMIRAEAMMSAIHEVTSFK